MSHVLNTEWLVWQKVTHVVCCVGAVNRDGTEREEWRVTRAAREGVTDITFYDWCINNAKDQRRYLHPFTHLHNALAEPQTCVYTHCKNGKDRSAITVFALLVLMFGVSPAEARDTLKARVDVRGQSIANLDYRQDDAMEWLDGILSLQTAS